MTWEKVFYRNMDVLSVYNEVLSWRKYNKIFFENVEEFSFTFVDGAYLFKKEERERVMQYLLEDPFHRIPLFNKSLETISVEFLEFCKSLTNFKNKTNQELAELFKAFMEEFTKTSSGWPFPLVIEEAIKTLLEKYLVTVIDLQKELDKFNETMATLFAPEQETEMFKERKELLTMVREGVTEEKLVQHTEKYAYMGLILLSGKPWTVENIKKRIAEIKNPQQELEEMQQQRELVDLPITNPEFNKVVQFAKDLSFLRTFHLEKANEACFHALPFMEEIAARMDLTYDNLIYLLPEEIEEFLREEKEINREEIKKRQEGFAVVNTPEPKIFTEDDVERLRQGYEQQDEKTNEVSGQVAFKGIVQGSAKIVNDPSEIHKVNRGDILVSEVTTPDFIPAMEKAAAFVTNIGGITAHAAIVAREMKKPCIVGTNIATKIFKDGDLVKVDANQGIVRKLK